MKTVCPRYGFISLYIIFILSLLVSCGSLEEQLGGSITLEASPTSIPADGYSSSTITATVCDSSGNPVPNGTTVTFTTDLGSFSGSTSISVSTSDDTGVVTVSLIAGTTPGTATITAEANSISQLIKVSITDSGGGTASITLTADPTSIPADGYSSSTITAELKDSSDDPVSPGTSVTFTTDLGSFPGGSMTYSTWTPDTSGKVAVSLSAGTTPGTATITAESNNVTQSITVSITDSGGGTASITLTADPTSIPADGSDSIITATLKDSSDDPVSPGTSVTFTTDLGSFPGGSTTYSTWTPDTSGKVAVSLSAGTTPGTATVTAKSNNISQYITVPIIDTSPGETASITLTADPTSIPADGYSSSTITAELKDSSDDPVSPGTSVTFTTDLGSFPGGSTTYSTWTPDTSGKVAVSLSAGTTSGRATVTAESNNVTQAVTVTFTAP